MISIRPMHFASFHEEDCTGFSISHGTSGCRRPLLIRACAMHTKSGAIGKHKRQEHNMLVQGLRSYLIYTFYFLLVITIVNILKMNNEHSKRRSILEFAYLIYI